MCKKAINNRNDYKLRNTIFTENETITLTGQILCKKVARYGVPESILLKNIKIVGSKYAGAQLDHLWIHVADITNYRDQTIRIGDKITLTGSSYKYLCTHISKGISSVDFKRGLKSITILSVCQTVISLGIINGNPLFG